MEGNDKPTDSERSSLPPSRGPAHNWRVLFAALWIGAQLALIVTAGARPDSAFGFRMFPESTTITVALYREVESADGGRGRDRMHAIDGAWVAKGLDGKIHRFSWYDRVPMPVWIFDRETNASYGAAAQLSRLQLALDDVAAHIPDDAETTRFALDVTLRRNGREPVVHHLVSRERISMTREEVH